MNLKGTKTEENLIKALQGEALAHLKYQFYKSKIANFSKEYESIIDEIVHNEKEHGKLWFKALNDGVVPDDVINLGEAYFGERYEHIEMYPHFSRVAKEEGFEEIAKLFEEIGKIEGHHMEVFETIKNEINANSTFKKKNDTTVWKCLNCGYQYEGDFAVEECPVCKHQKKYFVEIKGKQ